MTQRSDDSFRLRPRPPKGSETPRTRSFLSRVAFEIGKAGGGIGHLQHKPRGRGAKRGRGWVAARLMDSNPGPFARRVAVKTRLVVLKHAGPRSVATHLRYIVRDGISRDGQPVQAYDAETDTADVKVFEERAQDDRHQFRVIVAPEDGIELHDLRDFTRQFMKRMEGDLRMWSSMDWMAGATT